MTAMMLVPALPHSFQRQFAVPFMACDPYMLSPTVLPSIPTCASTLATARASDSLSNGRMEFSNTIFFFLSEIL